MAEGGDVYGKEVPWFNGNLFDAKPPLDLAGPELVVFKDAARLDWSQMDPSIFGTLFERVMDPAQRSRLGAQLYNDRPMWLSQAHNTLDDAVFAAYGWPADLSDDAILANLLALNLERAGDSPAHPEAESAIDEESSCFNREDEGGFRLSRAGVSARLINSWILAGSDARPTEFIRYCQSRRRARGECFRGALQSDWGAGRVDDLGFIDPGLFPM